MFFWAKSVLKSGGEPLAKAGYSSLCDDTKSAEKLEITQTYTTTLLKAQLKIWTKEAWFQ
jgi:hypothetical protein